MKYAQEIIDLMGAYPGRAFRMREIVKYVSGKEANDKERKQVRIGVWRVLNQLNESGQIMIQKRKETERHPGIHGGIKSFRTRHKKRYTNFLKALHEVLKSVTKTITLSAGQLRPQDSEARLV